MKQVVLKSTFEYPDEKHVTDEELVKRAKEAFYLDGAEVSAEIITEDTPMTLEQSISAVESIIEQYRIEIPEDLMKTIDSKSHARVNGFGYFNGRKVISSVHTFNLRVKRISKSTNHYVVEFSTDGENEMSIVNTENIDEFCDKIADIQNVVVL